MFPAWYTDFWCPADMRKYDPQGCGVGLGIGAMLALLLAVGVVLAVGLVVIYFWPAADKDEERARFMHVDRRRKD